MTRTVIIGAGQAGRRTAELLRELDDAREIVLLGDEAEPPYDRPPLSKEILLGEERPRGLMQRDVAAYADRRIELRLREHAVRVDAGAARVELETGESIAYDDLVFATGARARRLALPGAEDPRVVTLRSLADALFLRKNLRPGTRLAIIGAGLIGLEVAASAAKLGCIVTVIEATDRVMARSVPPVIGARVEAWHREAGVALQLNSALRAIVPTVSGLRIEAGEQAFEADILLVAIGAAPNLELAATAGLDIEDGILVDACGRTSVAGMFATGEVARIRRDDGTTSRFETWQVAQHQPVSVAHALCGMERPYGELPWHWTDQHGHNVQILGAHGGALDWIEREEPDKRLAAFGLDRADRVRAAVLIDNGREATPVRRIIAGGQPMERTALLDPSVALRRLG